MAILKDGPDLDGKLFSAGIALIKADPGALAVHFADSLLASAMRANRTIGPYSGFNKGISGFFVVKWGDEKIDLLMAISLLEIL